MRKITNKPMFLNYIISTDLASASTYFRPLILSLQRGFESFLIELKDWSKSS